MGVLLVEPATDQDLERLSRIAARSLSHEFSPGWLAEHLGHDAVLVARDLPSDEVMGFAVARREEPCLGRLLALAVDPARQGLGVGSALVREVKQRLAIRGALQLCLEARLDDRRAQEFYLRHGFRPEGVESHVYRDGVDAVRFSCPL